MRIRVALSTAGALALSATVVFAATPPQAQTGQGTTISGLARADDASGRDRGATVSAAASAYGARVAAAARARAATAAATGKATGAAAAAGKAKGAAAAAAGKAKGAAAAAAGQATGAAASAAGRATAAAAIAAGQAHRPSSNVLVANPTTFRTGRSSFHFAATERALAVANADVRGNRPLTTGWAGVKHPEHVDERD